jgi:hypothetical protein
MELQYSELTGAIYIVNGKKKVDVSLPFRSVMVEYLKRHNGINLDDSENLVLTHTLTGGGKEYTITIKQKSVAP